MQQDSYSSEKQDVAEKSNTEKIAPALKYETHIPLTSTTYYLFYPADTLVFNYCLISENIGQNSAIFERVNVQNKLVI